MNAWFPIKSQWYWVNGIIHMERKIYHDPASFDPKSQPQADYRDKYET